MTTIKNSSTKEFKKFQKYLYTAELPSINRCETVLKHTCSMYEVSFGNFVSIFEKFYTKITNPDVYYDEFKKCLQFYLNFYFNERPRTKVLILNIVYYDYKTSVSDRKYLKIFKEVMNCKPKFRYYGNEDAYVYTYLIKRDDN